VSRLLSLLGLRSTREDEDINVVRRTWPEYDIEHSRGSWRATRRDGRPGELTGRTPGSLSDAICADWRAGGMS
jgi:hypothetical protein